MAKKEPTNRQEALRVRFAELVKSKVGYTPATPGVRGFNSTGSLPLDYHIGQGRDRMGFPQGRVVEVFGPNGCGKTGLAMEAGTQAQKAGGMCILYTIEGLDDRYAKLCGLNTTDPNRWDMYEVANLETCWAMLEAACVEYHKVDYPVVLIVDSISAMGLASEDLHEKGAEESTSSAGPAKFLHGAFRRGILHYLTNSTITIILIRHQTSGVRAGQGSGTTHGNSIDYHAWVRLQIYKSSMDKVEGESIGHWRNVKCVKSKVGKSPWEISQPFYDGVGRPEAKELFKFLKDAKALERRGAYYVVNNDSKYERDWVELMESSPEWLDWFRGFALEVCERKFGC